jgi:hypothetical protein
MFEKTAGIQKLYFQTLETFENWKNDVQAIK